MKNKVYVLLTMIVFLHANNVLSQELGQVTEVDQNSATLKFYIGDIDVKVGEDLDVFNSAGIKDIKVKVKKIDGNYAEGEVFSVNKQARYVEKLHNKRKVQVYIDRDKLKTLSFFAGLSQSEEVGEFGGANYGLGLSVMGPFSWLGFEGASWSISIQADDFGEDSDGNGKRSSYYMMGVGQRKDKYQLFASIGIIDNMTMPVGGSSIVDPYTGAVYPDNVENVHEWGFRLMAKYLAYKSPVTRNNNWGWAVGPMVTHGQAFSSDAYKATTNFMVVFDAEINE